MLPETLFVFFAETGGAFVSDRTGQLIQADGLIGRNHGPGRHHTHLPYEFGGRHTRFDLDVPVQRTAALGQDFGNGIDRKINVTDVFHDVGGGFIGYALRFEARLVYRNVHFKPLTAVVIPQQIPGLEQELLRGEGFDHSR